MSNQAIPAPALNPNDIEVTIVTWLVQPWDHVVEGQLIGEVETTKVSFEVEAPETGYFYPAASEGMAVQVGRPMAWIFDTNDAKELERVTQASNPSSSQRLISKQARQLMDQLGLDEPQFADSLLTIGTKDIETLQRSLNTGAYEEAVKELDVRDDSVLIYGAGSFNAVMWEHLVAAGRYTPVAFVDYGPVVHREKLCELPVLHRNTLEAIRQRGVRFLIIHADGDAHEAERIGIQAREFGFELVNAVHPSASIANSATIGQNVVIDPQAIVGPLAVVEDFAMVLNGASIAHHSKIGKGTVVTDGARIAGNVTVGDWTVIGIGATVNYRLSIGNNVTVVSGVSVYDHVPDDHVVRSDGTAYALAHRQREDRG